MNQCDYATHADGEVESSVAIATLVVDDIAESERDETTPAQPLPGVRSASGGSPDRQLASSLREQIAAWNATERAFPTDVRVTALFEAQVARTPDAAAVTFAADTLTYRQLNARANQLAQWLRGRGIASGDVVGLYIERSLDLVIGIWGILKAGATYVPLDPEYPQQRVAYILKAAAARGIVTQTALVAQLPNDAPTMICLDDAATLLDTLPTDNLSSDSTSENLAYIIYTSGSTGQPKGVQIRHRSLVNVLQAMGRTPGVQASDTMLAHATPTFDVSVMELYLPFMVGARVVIVPREVAMDGQALAQVIANEGVTLMQATPTTWNLLLGQGWQGNPDLTVWSGGEPLTPALARALLPRVKALWNLYGPTETTVWSSIAPITDPAAPITIGRPLDNTRFYILDEHRQPVPIGEAGELYIAGAGLAQGYQGRPDLTAASFVADPWQATPGALMYRTGDRARYLPDGRVVCLGRLNAQVKLRGYRIELGEIEATLARHPAIALVAVAVKTDAARLDQLAAYYQVRPGNTVDWSSLNAFARAELPNYMVPALWQEVTEFPRTTSGKIDRQALPAPTLLAPATVTTTDEQLTPIEQQLIAIWRDVLQVPVIAATDNFFYIGGHSLLAVVLAERITVAFGTTLPLATIFRHPTVAELARVIGDAGDAHAASVVTALNAQGTKTPLFYLPGGWAASAFYCYNLARELGPDQPLYILDSVTFDGAVDVLSIEAIAARYVEEIRAIQPRGPYQLAGFCNGALFAAEIARVLQATGAVVDTLLLIEPMEPTRLAGVLRRGERVGRALRIDRARQLDLYLRLRHVWKFAQPSRQKRLLDREYLRARDAELDQPFPARQILRKDYIGVLSWLSDRFEQRRHDGHVSVMWASDDAFARLPWRQIAQRFGTSVDVAFVKGTYLSSRVEHLHDFAQHISHVLDMAELRRKRGALMEGKG